MWKHVAVLAVLLLGSVWIQQAPASVELVKNGGFETGNFSDWTTLPAPSYSDIYVSSYKSHSGTYGAVFGAAGSIDDAILQSLPTVPGQLYKIDFWLTHPYDTYNNDFTASWDGKPILSLVKTGSFVYTEYTFTLPATGSSTTIQFSGRDVTNLLFLDDVSVQAAIPEPTTLIIWSLLGTLAITIGWWRRKRVA
ncbi:MAG: carbohydrate binding domain-containing protein [Thermoguttaceae bacterium]|jgi:hypothetical protein